MQVFQVEQIALEQLKLSHSGWKPETGRRVLGKLAASSISTLTYVNLVENGEWVNDEVVDDLVQIISVNK